MTGIEWVVILVVLYFMYGPFHKSRQQREDEMAEAEARRRRAEEEREQLEYERRVLRAYIARKEAEK